MSKRNPHNQQRLVFSQLLNQTRKERKITQVALSKKLGKPQSFVSKYENGERILDIVEIYQLCLALNIKFIDLMQRFDHQITLLNHQKTIDA